MQYPRSFASDNNAGVHPQIMKALEAANQGQYVSYGTDPYTERALRKFKEHFGEESETFFVFNGTAANVLSMQALVKPYQAILCSASSHMTSDECGAPEKMTGSKLILVQPIDGKLRPSDIEKSISGVGDQHHVQAKVLSITQSTEFGTVYTIEELKALAALCCKYDLYFHMDGARIANAAASLNVSLKALTTDVGVDVLSFGGTKNGILAGEAVVFLKSNLALDFKFIRKQGMQLASKMRYMAVQLEALLTDDLWLKNARHANQMTQLLMKEIANIPEVKVTHKAEVNAIFATLPAKAAALLQKEYFFYVFDEAREIVRWMTSFETTEEDVKGFASALKKALKP